VQPFSSLCRGPFLRSCAPFRPLMAGFLRSFPEHQDLRAEAFPSRPRVFFVWILVFFLFIAENSGIVPVFSALLSIHPFRFSRYRWVPPPLPRGLPLEVEERALLFLGTIFREPKLRFWFCGFLAGCFFLVFPPAPFLIRTQLESVILCGSIVVPSV